uniref:Chorismate synthase n=1 Tax=candidate division WOR-3 bacterium TaxID=2052148 RepID=A0A7C6EIP3_UNCW3
MIRILSGGESHGLGLTVIIDGIPAGLKIKPDFIDEELKRRRSGKGRSERMKMEEEKIEITSGVKNGMTIGSPITLFIRNTDYRKNEFLSAQQNRKITIPRPGHADLAGLLKFGFEDIQDVLERASARETVSRVAAGGIFKIFLNEFGIHIGSRVISTGPAKEKKRMLSVVEKARKTGDTLGGIVEIYADNVCPGLGSYTQFDKRLDALIGMVMLSIPSVKGIEIGEAIKNSIMFGSRVHDEIFFNKIRGFYRKTNNAGGIEGGISNGERILIRLYAKPIPTLKNPLYSIDIKTKKRSPAPRPRADVCVIESVGVIGEAMLAYALTSAFCEKFGSDSLADIKRNYRSYLKRIKNV